MSLSAGDNLGPHEILALIGAGGHGRGLDEVKRRIAMKDAAAGRVNTLIPFVILFV
jgi:hypothetical protein